MEDALMPRLGQRWLRTAALLGSVIAGTVVSTSISIAAAEVSHGEMAAAIRSANYPCAHVLSIESAGDNKWIVKCNSGAFSVSRDEQGRFAVTSAAGNPTR